MASDKSSEKSTDGGQRKQAVDLAVTQIEKRYGKGAIMRLGDGGTRGEILSIPTGSLGVDIATGIGGVPRGRIIEVFGPESSGKTTLALHVVANVQRHGGIAAFVDAEHALDPEYAAKLGVKTDNLLVSQPDDGEQALEIVELLVRSAAVDCIVIDSVAALVPRAEIEGEMGDSHVGLQARLMSQAMRKLAGIAKRTQCCLIFINQIREKIGVMFGSPETTPGGHALKFYASMRFDIRRIGALKDGEKVIGNRTRVKVVKNKVAPPFRQFEFDILYGEGISLESDLIDLGVQYDIVTRSGSWLSIGDLKIGQGKETARKFLKDSPEITRNLDAAIRKAAGLTPTASFDPETKARALAAAEAEEKQQAAARAEVMRSAPTVTPGRQEDGDEAGENSETPAGSAADTGAARNARRPVRGGAPRDRVTAR